MPAPKTRNPQPRPSFARLEARINPAQKELVQKAAALAGRSLTDFVVGCALQEAQRIVHENEVIKLSARDREVFVKALLKPPAPNKAALKAARMHARQIGDEL